MHGHAPVLLGGATEEFQRQLAAPDGGKIPLTVHVHGLAQVVGQIVFIEVQFGAVDEIHARGEYGVLFLQEGMEKLRRHRRFNAHARQVLFGDGHVSEHAVGAIRGPEVEAQFVQPGAGKGAQVFLVCADAVGVHVLVDAGGVEFGDDVVVDLDLHERFEVDVGDARRRAVDGEQKFDVLRAKARAADLPQALANGRYAVEHAEIVAEFAACVALVGLAHGAQPRAQEATAAAVGELFFRADVIRAAMERLKIRDLAPQRLGARVRRGLDLRKHGQGDLLLARQERFILRQAGEKFHPHQGVPLGDLHRLCLPCAKRVFLSLARRGKAVKPRAVNSRRGA